MYTFLKSCLSNKHNNVDDNDNSNDELWLKHLWPPET